MTKSAALLIALGGFLGTLIRYLLMYRISSAAQIWTLVGINICGSLILGIVTAIIQNSDKTTSPKTAKFFHRPETIRLMWGVGFCGSLTTFSTFAKIIVDYITSAHYIILAIYLTISIICGVCAAAIGYKITSRIIRIGI